MLRTPLSITGLLMVVLPRTIVETAESIAFENPEDATLREWTVPMARLEGLGYLILVRRSGILSGLIGMLFGFFGSAAAVTPRRYLEFGLSLAYENPNDIVVKSWVVPVTRLLGLGAVLLTIRSLRSGGGD